MAKKKKKNQRRKRSLGWFIFGMFVYAAVVLGAAYYGLKELWVFLEAYEASRDYHAIDAYMEQLSRQHICDTQADLIAQVDHNIQSEEECRQVLLDAISEEITYARKASECTDTRQVYVLRSGKQVIGSFAIEAEAADEYGFTPWEFAEESFDLSYLIGETVSATAPMDYPVYVNGVQLDDSYVTGQTSEEFEVLEEYYEDYDLPVFYTKTYEAGPFLGNFPMEVTDPEGNPYVYDEASFDKEALIHNCTEEETEALNEFMDEFIKCYVVFAGCANDDRYRNYDKVIEYVVPNSNLAQRMHDAVEGMQFAQSMGDEVDTITIHHLIRLEEGRYLCDVTYLVNTTGREGVVQTTSNAKIIILESGSKLLVESMIAY